MNGSRRGFVGAVGAWTKHSLLAPSQRGLAGHQARLGECAINRSKDPVPQSQWLPCVGGAVTPSGVTEGVNAIDTIKAIVRSSPTRLLPYTPSVCPKGQPPPPTQGRQTPRRKFFRNSCGRGMPPPLHSKMILPTAPHPSRAKARATFPQGKASLRRVGTLLRHPIVHPLSQSFGLTAPPAQESLFRLAGRFRHKKSHPPG